MFTTTTTVSVRFRRFGYLVVLSSLTGLSAPNSTASDVFVPAASKGWYNHAGTHTAVSHFTGFTGSATIRAYHTYSFGTPVPGTIWAVQLYLFNPSGGYAGDANETLGIYEVTTPIATLVSGTGGVPAFNDLVDGTNYGGALVDASFNGVYVIMNMSSTFVGLANTANSSGGDVALGTALTSLACCYPQYVFGFSGAAGSFLRVYYETCGNGAVGPTETCDDGNTNGDDGCSSTCQVESGYFCSGSPSICFPDCNSNAIDDGTESLDRLYVDQSASGANNGSSWTNAFTSLQSALDLATACSIVDEIWVADGVYNPTSLTSPPDPRSATFQLQSGLAIYGGFVGNETLLSQRDPWNNATALSGDIGTPGNTSDNTYHVVFASGVDSTSLLDGFRIVDGRAQGAGPHENGAGLFLLNSSPNVRSCAIGDNDAPLPNGRGGGVYLQGGSPQFEECVFSGNTAETGGAFRVKTSGNPGFTDCYFGGNSAVAAGAIAHSDGGTSTITRCRFEFNSAPGYGGGALAVSNGAVAAILDSDFVDNDALNGAGIHVSTSPTFPPSSVTVQGGYFESNEGQQGGAAFVSGIAGTSATFTDCDFYSNTGHQGGGGAHVRDDGSAYFEDCTFRANGSGGADAGVLYAYQATIEVRSSRFLGNTSGNDGGAISIAENSSLTVLNSLFSGNSSAEHGGAINMKQSTTAPFASVADCTFANNLAGNSVGGAVHVGRGGMNVRNTIFWNNTPSNRQIYISGGGIPTYVDIDYSDIQNGASGIEGAGQLIFGTSNWNVDPFFKDANGADNTFGTLDDDYRLGDSTRCIDAGANSVAQSYSLILDLNGHDRYIDSPALSDVGQGTAPIVDIGAIEWFQDCNDNDIDDADDLTACAGDPACSDCNANGILDECDIASGPSTDNNANNVPDECDPMVLSWNSDPASPLRATRSVTISAAAVTASGGLGSNAIQFRMIDLQNPVPPNALCCPPQNFSAYEAATCTAVGETGGCNRWLGPVQTFYESSGNPALGSFRGSRLQCTPHYYDWTAEPLITIVGAEVVPSSTYELRAYGSSCKGSEASCAVVGPAVTVLTRRSGDIASAYNPPATTSQPDAIDVSSAVNKFQNKPGSPSKRAAQIQGNSADPNNDIDAIDITSVVDAFRGLRFAYSGPCACPPTVTCNATACASAAQCPGGGCFKTCVGGTNIGLLCTNNSSCPGSTCGAGFCRDRCGRCQD